MSLYNIIKSGDLKLFSPFIEGGITKLKKNEKLSLTSILENYSKSDKEFSFNGNKIILDEEQHKIIKADPNQNIRILAGAGSGKTTTILCRIKYLLDNYTTPNRILILTFNKDSAENLKKRIIDLMGFKINIDIYTIDAFCCLLYHKYHNQQSYISLSEYVIIGRELMFKYGAEISAKYNYVFFDEFQDVNSKQFDILNEFVKNGVYLTVIGDDSQNIYQFRGTDNYFMINFDNIFKNTSTFTLTNNYRSTQLIIKLANNCIKYNQNQVLKLMKTKNEDGFRPKFILSETEDHQIEFIVSKIKNLIEQEVNPGDIVILSRNGYHLKIMETELIKNNIPLVACITDKIGDNLKKILEPNKVAVTTIHKSKGLEWSHVFILGFCNQHFPSHMNNNIKNIEEERRLFYVGVTRAKKRLYLMATHSEIPISCFIKENINYIKTVFNPKESKPEIDIFNYKDDNIVKEEYSVTDLILLLNTENIDEMRKNNLLTDFEIEQTDLITNLDIDKIEFTEEIKKGGYEADFGEFVDRYVTRQLIKNSKQDFKDIDCLMILNAILLSNEEMELYNKYKLKNIALDLKSNIYIDEETNRLIKKIKKQTNKSTPYQNIIKENTYPLHVLRNLRDSYINCQGDKHNNEIMKDVYNLSLCRNFNNDRRRLVYRNIYDLFDRMLSTGIKNNMDKYIDIITNNEITCKKTIYHEYKNIASLMGEIDLIDWTEKSLIDIKCSESDFKIEWYIQLLIYYTFLNEEDKKKLEYFSIINIMNGKYYKIKIPAINYDSYKDFICLLIKRDQNNYRPSHNHLKINSFQYTFEPESKNINKIVQVNDINKKQYIMVLDTETSGFYNDVLQLAYVLCDKDGKIIKEFNRYVKNRLPTIDSTKIHGIDINKIKSDGIDFNIIIKELIDDLSTCLTVVGHNVQYDLSTIQNDIRTYGISIVDEKDNPILNIFNGINVEDTMKINNKKIKLEELYFNLFNKKITNAHNAMGDVIATKECYFKIKSVSV